MLNQTTANNKQQMPPFMRKDRQYRQFIDFHIRAAQEVEGGEENGLYVEGVAATFDKPTTLYTFDSVEYKEQIHRDAFNGVDLVTDVIFNYNHGGKVLARTRNKTLILWVEADGLHMRARLDGTDEGRKIYEEIQGGYIDRMSFAFSIAEASYDIDNHTRTVLRVKKLYDVSAVDFPAYDTTSINARSLFETELENEHKAAVAAELRKQILKDQINQTIKNYGGSTTL